MDKRFLVLIGIGATSAFVLLFVGYSFGVAEKEWGWPESLFGAAIGGLMVVLANYVNGILSSRAQISAIRLADELERSRLRSNEETKSAKEIIELLDEWSSAMINAMVEIRRAHLSDSLAGLELDRCSEAIDRLRTRISSSFPELDDIILSFRQENNVVQGKMVQAYMDACDGDIPSAEFLDDMWSTPYTFASQIRHYIVERFIRRNKVEIPTVSRARLLDALAWQALQYKAKANSKDESGTQDAD